MKITRLLWDMPITIRINDDVAKNPAIVNDIFKYFQHIDRVFNIFNPQSEISRLNRQEIRMSKVSREMSAVLHLCQQTAKESRGFFSYKTDGKINPLGLVKGWALRAAGIRLKKAGVKNFYLEAGGDIQVQGNSKKNKSWTVGIRHPFDKTSIVKKIRLTNAGVATSGSYWRGHHIYNPFTKRPVTEIVSLTVIAKNVFDADRFATAAFAMGSAGINFLNELALAAYIIDARGIATWNRAFSQYVC